MFEIEKDRNVRSRNVIMQNVKESNVSNAQVRKDLDRKFVVDLLRDNLELVNVVDKIKHVIRLGKYEPSGGQYARLVKVVFDREEDANLVLKSAGKLKDVQDSNVKEVKIFRDLSQPDREKRKELVSEMKLKNEELKKDNVVDSKFIIRGDKLLKINVDPAKQGTNF